jgi:hypothetical protein
MLYYNKSNIVAVRYVIEQLVNGFQSACGSADAYYISIILLWGIIFCKEQHAFLSIKLPV